MVGIGLGAGVDSGITSSGDGDARGRRGGGRTSVDDNGKKKGRGERKGRCVSYAFLGQEPKIKIAWGRRVYPGGEDEKKRTSGMRDRDEDTKKERRSRGERRQEEEKEKLKKKPRGRMKE